MLGVSSPRIFPAGVPFSALHSYQADSPPDPPEPSPRLHAVDFDDGIAVAVSVRKYQMQGMEEASTAPAELGGTYEREEGDAATCMALSHATAAASGPSSTGSAHVIFQPKLSPCQSGRLSRGAAAGVASAAAAGVGHVPAAATAPSSPGGRRTFPLPPPDAFRQQQQQQLHRKPTASASFGASAAAAGLSAAAAALGGDDGATEVLRRSSSRPLFSFLRSGYGALAAEAAEASGSGAGTNAVTNDAGGVATGVDQQQLQGPAGPPGFFRASAGGMSAYSADVGTGGPHSADVLFASISNTADGSSAGLDAPAAAAISSRSTLGGARLRMPTMSQRSSSRCGGAAFRSITSSEDQVPDGGGGGGVEPYPVPASPQLRRFLRPACQSFDGTSADAVESPAQPAHHSPAAFPPHAAVSSAASSGGGSFRRARMPTAIAATAAVAMTADGHASAAHAPGIDSGAAVDTAAANSPLPRSQHQQHTRYSMARPAALSLPHVQQVAASDAASTAGLLLPTPPPMLQSPSAGGPRGLAASGATAMPACSSPKARQQGAMRSGGWCGGGAGGGGTGSPGPGGGDDMATPSSSSGYGGGASVPETAAGAAVVAPSPRGYGGIIFLYDGINGDGPQGSSGADARRGDEWQQSGSLPFFAAAPVTSRSPRASYSGGGGGGAAGSSRFGGGATGTSSEKSIRLPASVLTASTSTGGIAGNSSGASCVVGEDLARGLISGSSGRQLLPSSGVGALTGSPTRTRLARTEQRRSRQAVAAVSSLAPTGAGALPSNSYESASAPLLLPTVLGPLPPASPKLPASVTGMSSSSSSMAAGALAGAESAVNSALQPELQTRLGQRPGGSLTRKGSFGG